MYEISQDHLEIFFGSVRSLDGYYPTARQFQSAFNKLVVRINDIPSFNTGNCIPLEHIDILHYSSAHPVRFINRRLPTLTQIQLILRKMYKKLLLIMITIILKLKIIYIAGFVVRKLT